ncbi:recombinase family protein [Egicoccus sp. AB-alg6-2]
MKRCAIYTRLSKDADGTETATARQEADARAFAAAKGWTVAEVFKDVDLSAYRKVTRPGYESMLTALASRQVDGVLVWKLDRLVRSPAEFERFWAICETHDATLASVNEPVDTSNELGLVIVRILVAFARLESATMSLRLRSVKAASAKAGRPKHGGPRAFGLTDGWTDIVPHEADMIVDAAARVLAGESIRSIVLDWNRQSLTTSTGRPWSAQTLRNLLLQRRLCGQREHRGEIVADGVWPAILDVDTCDRLRTVLTDPARTVPHAGRTFLLSGILRCHNCDSRMRGSIATNGRRRYACPPKPEGCNGTVILADPTDQLLADMVCDALDSPDLASALGRPDDDGDDHAARIRVLIGRLDDLAGMWANGGISRREWMTARTSIDQQLEQARAAAAATTRNRQAAPWVGRGMQLRARWDDGLDLEFQRAAVGAVIDRAVIRAAVKGRNRFDADRIVVEWRA